MTDTAGFFTDERLVPDMAKALGGTTVAFFICFALSFRFTIRQANDPNAPVVPVTISHRLEAADKLLSTPFFALVTMLAIRAALELRADPHMRWHGISANSRWAMMLYVARMLMDMPIQQVSLANDRAKLIQMTAHHLLSALAIGAALVTGHMHFFACLDIVCELTTLFLNTLFVLKTLCAPGPAQKAAIAALGIGLFLSFIVFRLVLFPYWLYQFATDAMQNPKDTVDSVLAFEKFFYPAVTVFLLIISTLWMVPITKGVIKAINAVVGGKKPNAEETKKAS